MLVDFTRCWPGRVAHVCSTSKGNLEVIFSRLGGFLLSTCRPSVRPLSAGRQPGKMSPLLIKVGHFFRGSTIALISKWKLCVFANDCCLLV